MTDLERENFHFHSIEKGCKIKNVRIVAVDNKKTINSLFCEKHNVSCCACGWEWGWHYGNDNKAIMHNELQKKLNDKIRTKKICNISKNHLDSEIEHLRMM